MTSRTNQSNGAGNGRRESSCFDVAIVGSGLGGAAAAVVLGRAGYRVALIDRHEVYPPEFRAEKITGHQITLLHRLDLFECIAEIATPYDDIISARLGRVVDRKRIQEYGLSYQSLVNAVRAQLPDDVSFIVGIATKLEVGPHNQQVVLSNGQTIKARLVILASGLNNGLVDDLGIGHRVVHRGHTLCFGFTIAPTSKPAFDFTALTYYGAGANNRIDYVSFFPMAGMMRANLFSYHNLHDSWSHGMRDSPRETLLASLPQLEHFVGDFRIVDRIKLRSTDLRFADTYRIAGAVLIGDAFQTSCPAAGAGITRVLTDVDRLCNVHLPRWLESPGMDADKISQFYDDPEKQACDAHAYRLSRYRRALTVDPGIRWELRRRLIYPIRRGSELARVGAHMASRLAAAIWGGALAE